MPKKENLELFTYCETCKSIQSVWIDGYIQLMFCENCGSRVYDVYAESAPPELVLISRPRPNENA